MEDKEKGNNLPIEQKDMLNRADDTIQKGTDLVTGVNNSALNIQNTLEKTNDVINKVNNLGNVFLETRKIKSETELELKKIEENHKTINNHIDLEYSKQKHVMNKAEDVVDAGLKNNDIDLIKTGLETMSNVANHNPLKDLKDHLDEQINPDFDDDDFIIEI